MPSSSHDVKATTRLVLLLVLLPLVYQSFRLHETTSQNIVFHHQRAEAVVTSIHHRASAGRRPSYDQLLEQEPVVSSNRPTSKQQQQQQPAWLSPLNIQTSIHGAGNRTVETANHTTATIEFPVQLHLAEIFKNNHSFFNRSTLYAICHNNGQSMERFHYRHAPLLLRSERESGATAESLPQVLQAPIRIRILLFQGPNKIIFRKGPTGPIGDEMLNIVMDGFQRSPYFEILNNLPTVIENPATMLFPEESNTKNNKNDDNIFVWVIDMRRMAQRQRDYSIPEQTLELVTNHLNVNPRLNLKVVFMDYRDKVFSLCRRNDKGRTIQTLIEKLGSRNVRQVNQLVVNNRKWNSTLNFVQPGQVMNGPPCFDYPALHVPYTVRSEYAKAIQQEYTSFLPPRNSQVTTTRTLGPWDTERLIDVAHFWKIDAKHSLCNLRDGVNRVLLDLEANTTTAKNNVTILADFVSKGGGSGRTSLQLGYVQALLQSKIIVVAQRDQWEDHYRFFEAMIGGALVMTDPMLSLPEGYINGTNLIVYKSFAELQQLILYYLEHAEERLAIARRGWELAMREHQSYQWMEKLFFGTILSSTARAFESS